MSEQITDSFERLMQELNKTIVGQLTTGGDNTSTTYLGDITGSGASSGLTKVGTGNQTLAKARLSVLNVNAGTVTIAGSQVTL